MSATNPIPFRNYAEPPRVDGIHAVPLARRLANTHPEDANGDEDERLREVQTAADAVAEVLTDRDRASTGVVRAPFLAFIAFIGALYGSLVATATLPETASDRSARAKRMITLFFPSGLSFTRRDASAVWSEGHRRLDQMDKDGLVEEIAALTGPEFYPVAARARDELGQALGLGPTAVDTVDTTELSKRLAVFRRAVAAYARLLAARVREGDAASEDRFRKAVAPIDEYRAKAGAESETSDETEGSEEQVVTPAVDPNDPSQNPFLPEEPT
jgi:hypothetical protein